MTSDSVKLKAIQSRFKPPRGWVPPTRVICGKQRKIPEGYLDESIYPTLHYSKGGDGVFCVACMLFSSGDMVLRTKPLTGWSNAKKIVSSICRLQRTIVPNCAQGNLLMLLWERASLSIPS